jgi:hypothetical protein
MGHLDPADEMYLKTESYRTGKELFDLICFPQNDLISIPDGHSGTHCFYVRAHHPALTRLLHERD